MPNRDQANVTAAARAVTGSLRLAVFAAASIACAAVAPPPILAATLSGLLAAAAAGTALVGALASERVFEDRLTYWDETALLLMAAVAAGAFARAGEVIAG